MAFCSQCGTASSGGAFCAQCGASLQANAKQAKKSAPVPTPFPQRCEFLGDLWSGYKNDSEFFDFFEYNDLGLPLAYLVSRDIVDSTPKAEKMINETWELLMSSFELTDTGFGSLDEVLGLEEDDEEEDEE